MILLGHEDPWRQFRDALSGPRMHHAWLLAGKRGLGKMQFALAAARELVGATKDGPHPDIHVLTHLPKDEKEEKKRDEGKAYETKRSISVGQIRAMQQRLTTRPTMGDRRAIIIDPADDLEKSAANALLKSLEEPPAGTNFLLVAHRPARLLPTIRSRCRMLRFAALDDAAMAQFLAAEAPQADADTRAAAILAAGGSPGAALAFVQFELGPIYTAMQRILEHGDPDFRLRGKLSALIGVRPDRDRIHATLDLARSALAHLAGTAPREGLPPIIEAHADLARLTGQASTYNFDPALLVMEIGTLLAHAAHPRERADA